MNEPVYAIGLVYWNSCFSEFTPSTYIFPNRLRHAQIDYNASENKRRLSEYREQIAEGGDPDSYRAAFKEIQGDDRVAGPYAYNNHEELPDVPIPNFVPKNEQLAQNCRTVYELMLSENDTGWPLDDESEMFRPFREMMYRVSLELNARDWSNSIQCTDDFIIFAIDCHMNKSDEDFVASP